MNRFEEFTIGVLRQAQSAQDAWHIHTHQLALQYGIEEKHVRERLIELYVEKFIHLSAWDQTREKQFDQWPNAHSFFNSTQDGGHKRIRLLIRGAEFLENMRKHEPSSPIGFTS